MYRILLNLRIMILNLLHKFLLFISCNKVNEESELFDFGLEERELRVGFGDRDREESSGDVLGDVGGVVVVG